MRLKSLIHTIRFYKTEYIDNQDGTGTNSLIEIKKVKCSVEDITYKEIISGKRNDIKKTLKVHTYYFKDFEINGVKTRINNDDEVFNIINIENVNYKNKELIFTLVSE